ncbi:unnamed protein product [Cylindrotheca closterium]|uniref:START domain-containing protein n=1 Tax=Cylindrotheca closterium TaxID=2856 RepID=A0AAD2FN99_9STRA|nr:unnamed protein product [Cylindrotheca closterium]
MPSSDVSERSSRRFFFKGRSKKKKSSKKANASPFQLMQSLGTGSMSPAGAITFVPSPTKLINFKMNFDAPPVKIRGNPKIFSRSDSSFIRVSDLDMDSEHTSCSTVQSEDAHPNFHHPAIDPPPGIETDEKEKWIALNDGDGAWSPIAPLAVSRLAALGLATSIDDCMWNPDRNTDKLLKKSNESDWMQNTFKPCQVSVEDPSHNHEVLVWTGTFSHSYYGSDLPAIRVAGVVDMSPQNLVELLVDSGRVKEYNKLSLGREDLVVFQNDMQEKGPFGCSVTKVMKSVSKPPMIRTNMVFVSVLHARELEDGSGFLIVTRAVHHPENEMGGSANVIKSEILMGVNLIRKINGADNQCLMINVNHIRSPMVPMMIAKKLGVSAAIGFVNDIRAAC